MFTCEVDMRDVSWRPVRSEEEMFTGAPRWRRMLTFLSFSKPEWGEKKTLQLLQDADEEAKTVAAY